MDTLQWQFIDNRGTFVAKNAHRFRSLYFPLCNTSPLMASVSPFLCGDLKQDYHSFLLEPSNRSSLTNLKASRNFWIAFHDGTVWSATGVSKDLRASREDRCSLEAGLLWQTVTRSSARMGLRAAITSFIPSSGLPVEIMRVTLTNITERTIRFTPIAAIPFFGRSPDNLHDHRHVTSLLNRIHIDSHGVILTPTLRFDESGHRPNTTSYFILGCDEKGNAPRHLFAAQEEFCGEGGDLEAPQAVYENRLPDRRFPSDGKEAMGGLRFPEKSLAPGRRYTYIILMGIAGKPAGVKKTAASCMSAPRVERLFKETRRFWEERASGITVSTGSPAFDNWFRWVAIQPTLRRIFGCSFLPDFDYGKGGRGWRDLWQDCLSLTLTSPDKVRSLLIDNFSGVRIDGSNATIIGSGPGEFIADRNSISRVWMDHGIWPFLTTLLYIHQTGDCGILLEKTTYVRDAHACRSREYDAAWKPEDGIRLKTASGTVYRGTLLEHVLTQHLVQFFNVGAHNHIRLENADWNDGLDMAAANGESVAFTCMYAHDLRLLCQLLQRLQQKKILVAKELLILIDARGSRSPSYGSLGYKRKRLQRYYDAVRQGVGGAQVSIETRALIDDLARKSAWITRHVRSTEWLKEGFFNGYYDDAKRRLEGHVRGLVRMTLTGQVFPVMSGVATDEQVATLYRMACRYLRHPKLGGFRLNTDFKEEQHRLGRAFSFAYGEKENGAFFNHMQAMFAYGLYARGFATEAYAVCEAMYRMATDTKSSIVYPGLPEYFNARGRGMYQYLTGSASWFVLTLLTQSFGVRGEYGDLLIEPKLVAAQFARSPRITLQTAFAGKRIEVAFTNRRGREFGSYRITDVRLNGNPLACSRPCARYLISRRLFLKRTTSRLNRLEITLE